ncbi:hypothetical protein JN09_000350 [Acholeplasma morum]|uniref:O-antigen ligase family protein n=1 Tax=Paracholeplasma morum TaxID=264637 RepID=UPI0019596D39|nr:O-antigen ligase family protein [Paracholeplasma morum]MBM7453031.1 hypothetical protein [Paracholeplasma morum]
MKKSILTAFSFQKILFVFCIVVLLWVTQNQKITNQGVTLPYFSFNPVIILFTISVISLAHNFIFKIKLKLPSILFFAVLFVVVSIIPIVFIKDPDTYYGNLLGRSLIVLFFLMGFYMANEKIVFNSLILLGVIMSIQIVLTFMLVNIPFDALYYKQYMVIPVGASNHLSVMLLPLLIINDFYTVRIFRKILYSLILIIGIFLTKSRTGLIILCFLLIVKFIYYLIILLRKSNKQNITIAITLITTVLSVIVLLLTKIDLGFIRDFLLGFAKEDSTISIDALLSGRLSLLIEGFKTSLNNPLFGQGLEYELGAAKIHNWLGQLFYEVGLFGVIIFSIILIDIYQKIKKYDTKSNVYKAVVTVLLINSLIEPGIFTYQVDFIFWIIIGTLYGVSRMNKGEKPLENLEEK